MSADSIRGQCLCGAFQFQIEGALGDVRLCHCDICRRANGSAFSANSRISYKQFTVTKQTAEISEYQSSPGAWKCFCSVCGSPVYSKVESDPEYLRIRLGTLSRETQANIVAHVWVSSKAEWDNISDELPKFPHTAG